MANTMKTIAVEKLVLNFGAGKDQNLLNKGIKLIKNISGLDPVQTKTEKRIPTWGLRPGLPIGAKITLRGAKANELIQNLLKAKENKLKQSCFDVSGNVSFGIHEYIDIPGVEYDPEIGIIGLQVSITLKRPGFRVKQRSIKKQKVGQKHMISQEDSINFFKEGFNLQVGE